MQRFAPARCAKWIQQRLGLINIFTDVAIINHSLPLDFTHKQLQENERIEALVQLAAGGR